MLALAACSPNSPEPAAPKPLAATPAPQAGELPDFTSLAEAQGPAVVNISSSKRVRITPPAPGFGRPETPLDELFRHFGFGAQAFDFRAQSLGSGCIIDPDGYVLTSAHVIEGAEEVIVGLLDQRQFKAWVIGADRRTDIALLKISAGNLPFVTIGDPAKLKVGDWVLAIGTPFGFTNTVTQGIVSAKGRALPGGDIVPFIQTDAAINPGNSGGPLFNLAGEVVGINSQIYSRSGGYMGISFAIPIDVAIKTKDELLKYGTVRRAKLGLTVQDLTPEQADAFDLPKAGGALISSVEKGGPADRAGLHTGDIILMFEDKVLMGGGDLARALADSPPNKKIRLKLWRQGAALEVTVNLGEADKI